MSFEKGIMNKSLKYKERDNFLNKFKEMNIYDLRNKTQEQKVNNIKLKILVLNVQVLNKEEVQFRKKLNFLQEQMYEINPELVFLIDVGAKVQELNFVNYRMFNDGRNLLAIRADIKHVPKVSNGLFRIPELDLNFVYVRPMETEQVLSEAIDLIEKGYCVIGDMNVKSNPTIEKAIGTKNIQGESSKQTIIVKTVLKATLTTTFAAPSDHRGLIISLKRRTRHTSGVELKSFKYEETKQIVEDILMGKETMVEPKVIPVMALQPLDKEKHYISKIIKEHVTGNVKRTYKFYEKLWKTKKKEPFLGTFIPEEVFESLKGHYEHNEEKKYIDCPNIGHIEGLIPKARSFSKAATIEGNKLGDIDEALIENFVKVKVEVGEKGLTENVRTFLNKNKKNLMYRTFFLVKKKELKSFSDVRIISIVPCLMKIWESLIYNKIVMYLTAEIESNGKYQMGAIKGGSTYEAMFLVQRAYIENKGKGVLYLDLEKGYDTVQWKILLEDINKIPNEQVKNMLLLWYHILVNTDVECNEQRIRKGRGLGMGLSLAPMVFCWYVDQALNKVGFKDRMIMFIDDLCYILKKVLDKEIFEKIKEEFKRRGLIINPKKCTIISEADEVEEYKEMFKDYNIEIKDKERYLGSIILINSQNEIESDSRFTKISKDSLCLNKAICFGIKRLIFNGALIAKIRYSCMMNSLKKKIERKYLYQSIWNAFRGEIRKLSYVQVISFSNNLFRFCIDLRDLELLRNKQADVRRMEGELENLFISMVDTGIEQVDSILREVQWDIPEIQGVDLLNLKVVCDKLWKQFVRGAINNWSNRKENQGVKVPKQADEITRSKLYLNSSIIQEILFKHFDKEEDKLIAFLYLVFKQIVDMKKKKVDPDKWVFKMERMMLLKDTYRTEKNLKLWMEKFIDQLVYLMRKMMEWEEVKEDKKAFRKVLQVLFVLENMMKMKIYNQNTIEDLLFVLNLRLDQQVLNEEENDMISVVENEESVAYVTVKSDEELVNLDKIIAVDGCFNKDTGAIGSGVFVKELIDGFWHEERYFFRVGDKSAEPYRNIAGELEACIKALEIAKAKGWKKWNLIFDYVGVYHYTMGMWTFDGFTMMIKQAYWKIMMEHNMDINYVKVKSHSNIQINEEADRLAKTGAGCSEPKSGDVEFYDFSVE